MCKKIEKIDFIIEDSSLLEQNSINNNIQGPDIQGPDVDPMNPNFIQPSVILPPRKPTKKNPKKDSNTVTKQVTNGKPVSWKAGIFYLKLLQEFCNRNKELISKGSYTYVKVTVSFRFDLDVRPFDPDSQVRKWAKTFETFLKSFVCGSYHGSCYVNYGFIKTESLICFTSENSLIAFKASFLAFGDLYLKLKYKFNKVESSSDSTTGPDFYKSAVTLVKNNSYKYDRDFIRVTFFKHYK